MWKSNAKWTKISNSIDTHHTKRQAQAVCDNLIEDYGHAPGCSIRGVCTSAWVDSEDESADGECPFKPGLPCALWEACFNPCFGITK